MAKVFVSFVHEDEQVARAVQKSIEYELQIFQQVFIISDTAQVIAGTDWLDRIRTELNAAQVVVLMLSARSVKRPWVNFEAGAAWLANKVLIPVCYGNMSAGKLPKPYSNFQGVDLPKDEAFLFQSIARHLDVNYVASVLREMIKPASEVEQPMKELIKGMFRPSIADAVKNFVDEP
jgi:hypothetical protein